MTLVMVLLTIAVVAGVSAVATGMVSGGMAEPTPSIPPRALPNPPLTGQDVTDLRFVQAFRGYRMDQVDAAMDALGTEVERLRGLLAEAGRPDDAEAGRPKDELGGYQRFDETRPFDESRSFEEIRSPSEVSMERD